ncbi:hypothetical protein [Zongyangia hominis]|uniref:Sporulation integral membrane protein YlbJ n=1 Tax=Zongyangia hominis TaxID=2763677 RepID=A0A926EAD1_9FIRM|nr:hypothetical protein [Zongyangia hominis]MBC8570860.1 hypothetical protein [Zongyangia hominis]
MTEKLRLSKPMKTLFLLSAAGALCLGILCYPQSSAQGARDGLTLCAGVVIPSLFPFVVLACFLLNSGLGEIISRPFSPLTRHVFKLPSSCGCVILMSLLGGYPVGAKMIAGLLEQEKIDRKEAARMLCFCVNAGPAFLIGTVGLSMLHSTALGVILLISQILSSLLIGAFLGLFHKTPPKTKAPQNGSQSLPVAFVNSVCAGASSMFTVSAFIVFLSAVTSLLTASGFMDFLCQKLSALAGSQVVTPLVYGFLEVTRGCLQSAQNDVLTGFTLCSILVSFSSVSIVCQVVALIKDHRLNLVPFLLSRLAHAAITGVIAHLILRAVPLALISAVFKAPPRLEISYGSIPAAVCILILCAILLLSASPGGGIRKRKERGKPAANVVK